MADAVQTETEVAPAPDVSSSDLDTLLAEFEAAAKSQSADQSADPEVAPQEREIDIAHRLSADAYQQLAKVSAERAEVEQAAQQLRAQEDQRDEQEAFATIKGKHNVSDEDLQGFVMARAAKIPQIGEAWQNRRDNPDAFNRVVETMRDAFEQHEAARRQEIETQLTREDVAAVASAVRGANLSKPGPEPAPNFSRMSEAEFNRWKQDNLRP